MQKGGRILGFIALGVLFVVLLTLATMGLWNWLVPVLFSGPVITFWQALGLLALSKILFSGFGHKHWNHTSGTENGQWKAKFYEKFSNMTPEERDAFKNKMKEKWCTRPPKNTAEQ